MLQYTFRKLDTVKIDWWICIDVCLVRPVHLLRVSLLRVLESNFPGDPLSNYTDMRIPTP